MSNEIMDINEYKEILSSIKNEILKSQYRAMQVVNVEMIYMYWNIGKIISNNIKWGNKFVDNLAIDLKLEFPDITGFSPRNIRYMRKFADEYQDEKFLQEVLAKITWYHNVILMDKVKDIEREYKNKINNLDFDYNNRKDELEKEFKTKEFDIEYKYKHKIKTLEKENSHLHKIVDKFYDTVEKFIKWICHKFGIGESKELVKKFEEDTNILIDPEKQLKKEEREKEWDLEL